MFLDVFLNTIFYWLENKVEIVVIAEKVAKERAQKLIEGRHGVYI